MERNEDIEIKKKWMCFGWFRETGERAPSNNKLECLRLIFIDI